MSSVNQTIPRCQEQLQTTAKPLLLISDRIDSIAEAQS